MMDAMENPWHGVVTAEGTSTQPDSMASGIVTVRQSPFQFTGSNWGALNETGVTWSRTREGIVEVRSQNGNWHPLAVGSWVLQYGPGDYGVLSDGAMERFFPFLWQKLKR
jgi:hypothetical protein